MTACRPLPYAQGLLRPAARRGGSRTRLGEQFDRWFADAVAAELPEPNAVVLATADTDGAPDARVVLMKGYDEAGFIFGTSYASTKGAQLAANPRAALVFPWHAMQRQVRVAGRVERIGDAASDGLWDPRPRGASWPPSRRCSRRSSTRRGARRRGCGCSTSRRRPVRCRGRRSGAATGWSREGGVLAGRRGPAARPAAVRAGRRGGRRLDRAAAGPVSRTPRPDPRRSGAAPAPRLGDRHHPAAQPAYRRLFWGVAATMLGQQMTLVAVPFQVYALTGRRCWSASPRSSRWCR